MVSPTRESAGRSRAPMTLDPRSLSLVRWEQV